MEKFCKSCGMPMERSEDFANNNINGDYCYYCGDKEEYYNKEESYENELGKEKYYNKKEKKLSKITKIKKPVKIKQKSVKKPAKKKK